MANTLIASLVSSLLNIPERLQKTVAAYLLALVLDGAKKTLSQAAITTGVPPNLNREVSTMITSKFTIVGPYTAIKWLGGVQISYPNGSVVKGRWVGPDLDPSYFQPSTFQLNEHSPSWPAVDAYTQEKGILLIDDGSGQLKALNTETGTLESPTEKVYTNVENIPATEVAKGRSWKEAMRRMFGFRSFGVTCPISSGEGVASVGDDSERSRQDAVGAQERSGRDAADDVGSSEAARTNAQDGTRIENPQRQAR